MGRSKISGMTVDEYREWMGENMDGVLLKDDGVSVDDIVGEMTDKTLQVSSVNLDEFAVVAEEVDFSI